MRIGTSIVSGRNILLWGSLASCVPVGNRHARRLPIAAQDAILPHRNRTFPRGLSTRYDLWHTS